MPRPSPKQRCVDCVHFRRCLELVSGLRGDENACHWSPNRWELACQWDRASNEALAVGKYGPSIGKILNMDMRGKRPAPTGRPRGDATRFKWYREYLKKKAEEGGGGGSG